MEIFNFSKARKYVPNFYADKCALCGKELTEGETIFAFKATDFDIYESIACNECKKKYRDRPIPSISFV